MTSAVRPPRTASSACAPRAPPGVETAGGLVQHPEARIAEDGPGQGQPLPLSAAQPHPRSRAACRAAAGADEGGGGGDPERTGQRVRRGVRVRGEQVLPHRSGEEERLLGDQRGLGAERGHRASLDVDVVPDQPSCIWTEEAEQQRRHGALATAARAHQRGELADRDVQRQPAQRRSVAIVQADALQPHRPLQPRRGAGRGSIHHHRPEVEHVQDALRRRRTLGGEL